MSALFGAPLPIQTGPTRKRFDWRRAHNGYLARVWVSSSRLSMPPGDEFMNGTVEAEGGKVAYAWFVWERGHRGPPQLGWLP